MNLVTVVLLAITMDPLTDPSSPLNPNHPMHHTDDGWWENGTWRGSWSPPKAAPPMTAAPPTTAVPLSTWERVALVVLLVLAFVVVFNIVGELFFRRE